MGTENGHIGVVRFQFLITVTVDDGEIVVVIFLRHKAAGILAERAHLILERLGITDELGLVQDLVHRFHDLVSHLHAHADVDGAGDVLHAVLFAELFQPVRAAAARRNDGMPGADFLRLVALAQGNAEAGFAVHQQFFAFPAEEQLHVVVAQIVFQREIERLRLFRAEVADRAIDQLEAA